MVAEAFDEVFSVGRTAQECWDVLVDVPRISGWVPIVRDVTEVAPLERYEAVLEDRMGPFRLRADLDVVVTEIDAPNSITIRADGEDRQVGSRIVVDATLGLSSTDDGAEVAIHGTYDVTGRVATMGAGTIKQKASSMLSGFIESARSELS